MKPFSKHFFLIPLLGLVACGSGPCALREETPDLSGLWHGALDGPGGEVPFRLSLQQQGEVLQATAINGDDQTALGAVTIRKNRAKISIDAYDGEITAQILDGGQRLQGQWTKAAQGGVAIMPFVATRGAGPRFPPLADREAVTDAAALAVDPAGRWSVEITMGEEKLDAIAELTRDDSLLQGTFITPLGDYGRLAGTFERGVLRLSRFDGANAILIRGRVDSIGALSGTTWIGAQATQRFRAVRAADDGARFSTLAPEARSPQLRFRLPDLDGHTLSLNDPKFSGKVVLIDVMGTWCVTCVEQAPILARWHQNYQQRGLEIISIAFEVSADLERDRRVVRAYKERHRLQHTFLIGGEAGTEKERIGLAVSAYPTTVFIGRDGRVNTVHAGFVAAQTGEHHRRLVSEMERRIESLLGVE